MARSHMSAGTARVPVLLLLALVLAVAGCTYESGDDEAATTDGSAPSEVATAGFERIPELVREIDPSVVAVLVSRNGQSGEGSGVIVRSDGVIVTNNHVVAGAGDVRVVLADGTQVDAEIEATDPFTDLAVLRVEREDLPVVELASGYPEIGELAVAVGNPLGFENTVTAGIISGLGRAIPTSATLGQQALVDLVQTDAAISPGNSGGALVGADGRVVGINVAYIPPAAGAVSLGFAIPAPTVDDVVDELLEDGTAEHAFLGVQLETVTGQIADQLGLAVSSGAAVISTEPGSPAAEAGLEPGDVITAIDDERVADVAGLLTLLRRYDPGDTAELTVTDEGEDSTVDVELTSRPES